MLTFGKYIAIGGVVFKVNKDNDVEKKQDKCDKKNASGVFQSRAEDENVVQVV